ncbi:hypothetical protein [Maricaulis parjimensis]|uniref:hypothetical protein n=1 Tax=Maricaulis parjimensis TaxID=144023 RepID=UPI00193A0969|nr:hypothetical protein [Maricaulis parjimensis]
MRILVCLTSLVAMLALSGTAQANCRWQADMRLVGVHPGFGSISDHAWPLANLQTRVRVRTPGGWWNTANWPATSTDANGFASITSAVAFADPDCQTRREFEVQVRNFDTNMQWRTVYSESKQGPTGMTGLMSPAPVHTIELGNLVLDGEFRGSGVIFVEGIGDPPVVWSSGGEGGDDTGPQINDAPVPDQDDDEDASSGPPDLTGASLQEDPCHIYRLPIGQDVEFRFGQLTAQPGPVSPDQALRVENRLAGGHVTLNRLAMHFGVENAGQDDFHAVYHCPVEVHVRLNEGPGERGGDGWSNPWVAPIHDIAVNQVRPMAINVNLLGAGDDLVGEWGQDYEYVLIEITLDATNRIAETAEGDNTILHCFHAPSQSFAAMAQCEG